ncbi:MAG: HAMP domain-containing protein, partial [Anaerolineales bacterium]|nr:HAMP domain-containing protein [Anaerolineales bacterium]
MQRLLRRVFTSVSTKIIFPYLILTMIVGGVGAFVVTNLATSTLQERFDNQLLDAGRIVSESIIDLEQERLEVLRAVAFTEGLPQSLANQDIEALEQLIPPIGVNSDAFLISVLDPDGIEVLGWQQNGRGREGAITTQNDFSNFPDVQQVLAGRVDEFGDKRVLLAQLGDQFVLLTVGPVYDDDDLVGAVVVGESLERLVFRLSERSISRVTLLDTQGQVLSSALTDDFDVLTNIGESPERYNEILSLLDRTSPDYKVVVTAAAEEVPLRQIEVLGQTYRLAYGHWRLRDKSFGLFTVALPSNFIVRTVATSRDTLGLIFALSTVAVLTLGFAIARRILVPLEQLVNVSTAVVEGDLDRRTGIERQDEIGELAHSFDLMTNFLVTRNKEFAEQATNLETILNSIADGVILLDNRAR